MKNKVILVDDDATLCELGQEMFDILGIHCYTAMTMDEAVSIWKENHNEIGLAIFDLNLEECTGIEVFEALKAISPDFSGVVASGALIDSDAATYKAMGFKEIIQKPYSLNNLKDLIGKYLA